MAMARIASVLQGFRAVLATTMELSAMLAISAVGGVLLRPMERLLGFGFWTTNISIGTEAIAERVAVCLFVV